MGAQLRAKTLIYLFSTLELSARQEEFPLCANKVLGNAVVFWTLQLKSSRVQPGTAKLPAQVREKRGAFI